MFSVGSPGTPDKRAAGAGAARLCASAARALGEPCPHPNEDCFRLWYNFKCCGTRRENHPMAVNIHACTRHMEADQMLNIIRTAQNYAISENDMLETTILTSTNTTGTLTRDDLDQPGTTYSAYPVWTEADHSNATLPTMILP